jgi:hypothetical protein
MRASTSNQSKITSMTLGTAFGACSVLCFEGSIAAGIAIGVLAFAVTLAAFDVLQWLRSLRSRNVTASNVLPFRFRS